MEREGLPARRRAMWALTGGGIASTVAGAGLMATGRDDQAWRIAGGLTLGFGVINAMLGGLALSGLRREEIEVGRITDERELWRRLTRDAEREAVVFGVNVGLDVAYVLASGTAILASFFVTDHRERWLGAGIAGAVQGLFLLGVDVAGVVLARRGHQRLIEAAP